MQQRIKVLSIMVAGGLSLAAASGGALYAATGGNSRSEPVAQALRGAPTPLLKQGQWVFRYDTFGDEIKWTDALHLNQVIQSAVSPATALNVGLKVDVDALPDSVKQGIANGSVDLNNPQTTLALIKLNAVVGIQGTVDTNPDGSMTLARVGTTCALCHSTVDNSFAAGIGHRLDGWPNRDLNPGAIIALSPAVTAAQKAQLNSWGPGKYDPRWNFDGLSDPAVIPPAYGLAGIHCVVFTCDGPNLSYWNRYVAVTQMGGQGVFADPRVEMQLDPATPGLAPGWHPGAFMVNGTQDLVSGALRSLQAYQLSIKAPSPPSGSFDVAAARRGHVVFRQDCASCHSGPSFTDANFRLHPPEATAAKDKLYVYRSATGMWRTSPLRGIWQHPPYFHDGSAKTLGDVVDAYDAKLHLKLTRRQKGDLVEYLKSL